MQHTTTDTLGAADLADALRAGVYRLLGAQDYLDRINVFPVPDGDTGTNLAATASAILPALSQPATSVGDLLGSVADAALDGARGNSGAILAQWLLGFAEALGEATRLDRAGFAAALERGASGARDALSDPREGTILTVMREAANAANAGAADHSFAGLCATALTQAKRSLEATRHGLAVIEKADVVDAGAAGFVALLEGFQDFVESGHLDAVPDRPATALAPEAAGGIDALDHRWCTECLVSGDVDRVALRERLSPLGSSLVVAGTARKVRVHVHVADPGIVFQTASEFGVVSGEKADDMQRQQESTAHAGHRRVAVVTDSAADLPDALVEALDIHVVPVRLAFGNRTFLDKVTLGPEEFYRLLASDPLHPKTSQPPPGDFRRLYDVLCSHHQAVVSLHVSARLSGTWQSAQAAASRPTLHGRVHVVDTATASAGQGLLAIRAAECADRGLDAPAIVAAVEALLQETRTYAYLPTLDYAVRGGRVPAVVRTLARWLRVSPLLATRQGRLSLGGFLFGRRDPVRAFAAFVARQLKRGVRYRILVAHGDVPDTAARFVDALRQRHPGIDDCPVVPSGAALGVHGGPGFLAVGLHPVPADTAPLTTEGTAR